MSLEQYKEALARERQKTKELWAAVKKQVDDDIDSHDTNYISSGFAELQGNIMHIVKKNFAEPKTPSGWKEFDSIKAADDRDLFLQAHIATVLAEEYFSHDARLFSLDDETNDKLGWFEKILEDRDFPPQQLTAWRTQTIKVATTALQTDPHHMAKSTIVVPSTLGDNLSALLPFDQGRSVYFRLQALCTSAFELALAIRKCKVEYTWLQAVPPASLSEADVDRIEGYDVQGYIPTGLGFKVFFGPVYTRFEGRAVLLRRGRVLCS